jgi:hypothetical protein
MIPYPDDQPLNGAIDQTMRLLSRRTLLRRSLLGLAGTGMASLLVACGGDDESPGLPPSSDEAVPNDVDEEAGD